jgi:hypothetical protein
MCERIEEHFVATLEDESLSGFEEHLADCPRCQNDLERLTLLNKELKKVLTVPDLFSEISPDVSSGTRRKDVNI